MRSDVASGRIAHWLGGTESHRPLAILRIGLAALLLWQAAVLWTWRDLLLASDGLVAWVVSEQWIDPLRPSLSMVQALLQPLGAGPGDVVALLLGVHVVACAFLLAGAWTRAAAIVAWLTFLPIKATAFLTFYGIGNLMLIALFYCVVLPVGRAWSVDARRHPPAPAPGGAALPVMVLRLHLCIVYAAAGLSKAFGAQWWSGEAVWRALSLPQFQQVDPTPLLAFPLVLQACAIGAMLVQISYPVLVWTRLRVPIVIATELVHLGIAIFLGLWMFSTMMIVLNAAAFGESVWRGIESLSRRRRTGPA